MATVQDLTKNAISNGQDFTLGEIRGTFQNETLRLAGPCTGISQFAIEPTVEKIGEHIRFDEHGRYRPLSGARSVPHCWHTSLGRDLVEAAIEVIYPQALTHQEQAAKGTLRIITFEELAARQQGRYQVVEELSPSSLKSAQAVLCGNCVRTPMWSDTSPATPADSIPCPEPCSVMLELFREATFWQKELPESKPPNTSVAFAAFSTPGNEIREAFLRKQKEGVMHE
tara:strand:+ start:696 stop:1376 length:681 start_codon:yes stop_codon:yes gene_type:complete